MGLTKEFDVDDFFQLFLKKFGQPTASRAIPEAAFPAYEGTLPDCLLSYWREFGWCSFCNGLVWIVDPGLFRGLIKSWLSDMPEFDGADYYVFARSAFGSMYAYRPETGDVIRIRTTHSSIVAKRTLGKPTNNKERALQSFFATAQQADFDVVGEDDAPLFARVLDGLGPLTEDEVYGFEPLLALGGSASVSNLKRLRLNVHLEIMRQFSRPVLRLV